MDVVTNDLIEDLRDTKIRYSSKFFYLWCLTKFGTKREFNWRDCLQYGRTRRTLMGYFADLEEAGMIRRKIKPVTGKPGGRSMVKIL